MPTRYHIHVSHTRSLTFDAPEDMSRAEVYALLEAQAEKLLNQGSPQVRIEDSFEVGLRAVRGAPRRILRVNDSRDAITEEETRWADSPEGQE